MVCTMGFQIYKLGRPPLTPLTRRRTTQRRTSFERYAYSTTERNHLNRICGMSSPHSAHPGERARLLRLVVWLAAAGLLIPCAGTARAATPPKPQPLWKSYPLKGAKPGPTAKPRRAQPIRVAAPEPRPKPSRPKQSRPRPKAQPKGAPVEPLDVGHGPSLWLLLLMIAGVTVAGAVIAGLVLRVRGALVEGVPDDDAGTVLGSQILHSPEGGLVMNRRSKLWGRGTDSRETEGRQEQDAVIGPSAATNGAPAESAPAESAAPKTAREAQFEAGDVGSPGDLADVGAEVSAVLKSAQEAAARIRRQAREEASRIREEAKRLADTDRAEAARLLAEAETDAEATRAEAETSARQLRSSAEREAGSLAEEARALAARADAEVERRLQEAESDARRRRDALEAESQLYERRLEKMLGIVQGMGTQLEQLLDVDQTPGHEEQADVQTLEDALQREAAGERAG
jgi:hypothetical protein